MYAIVRTGGKQYRVEKGQRLLVERMAAEQGSEVALEPLMLRAEETVLDEQALASVKVTAKVLAHVRGEKLRVFKFKPKRGYRRRTGHRQDLTQIEVTDIAKARVKAAAGRSAAGERETAGAGATASKPKRAVKAAGARGTGAAAKGAASGKRAAPAKRAAAPAKRDAPGAAKASKAKPERDDGA
ncbi:MAG: 50S ribosomal protein L21 [Actinobacteria bacterium]|nr:MAG: 50S ribosomal protein L21 [Actinomycetota bacterium]